MPIGWISLLIACNASDPLRGLPSIPFDQTRSAAVALDRLEGKYQLAAGNLPPEGGVAEAYPIAVFRRGKRGAVTWWRAPIPFNLHHTDAQYPPPGMKLFYGEQELSWRGNFARAPEKPAWRIAGGQIEVLLRAKPVPGEVRVVYPTMGAQSDRLEFSRAALSATEFVTYRHTLGAQSRSGLLLPAPSSGTWTVRLPEGAFFSTQVAMIEPPLQRSRSDGAEAVLVVHPRNGTAIEAGRQAIEANATNFQPWTVSLDRWAGQEVGIELRTEERDTGIHDYTFFGAPQIDGRPAALPRRVVVLAVDTLRPDHLSGLGYHRTTSPELDAMIRDSVVFNAAYSSAPRTRPSFRTATTGRWPLEAVGATNLGSVMRDHGFATAGIVANVHLNPRFDFHLGYDFWWLDPEARAAEQVRRGLSWLEDNRLHDSFLFLHLMDPHLPYRAPDEFRDRFVKSADPNLPPVFSRWTVLGWQRKGLLTPLRKAHIESLYDGEIAYTSDQVGQFLRGIDALPGRTLVVFHSDHGEEFWEHNGYEHNHTLYDELVRVALWFRMPGLAAGPRPEMVGSLGDIAPTLYGLLGFTDAPYADGISLVPWLRDPAFPSVERKLPIGYLRYDRERWGVVVDHHKYILFTEDGVEELYDLRADPAETRNLVAATDLTPFRKALGEAHQIDVGPGWRIRVNLRSGGDPVTIHLPTECLSAGVIDPESTSSRPVNQEWGEVPPSTPADTGVVSVSEDRRQFTFTPGPGGSGLLYVRFARPVEPTATLARNGQDAQIQSKGPSVRWAAAEEYIEIKSGTLVVPPMDEAVRMADIASKNSPAAGSELDMLESLGYIGSER